MPTFGQVQRNNEYPAGTAPFNPSQMLGPQPVAHDMLDQVRMSWRATPEAMYPDGYLQTIRTRREDRLLDGLKSRDNNRPYTRGIHKGERIEQRDYYWPPEFNLWTGLETQAAGMRFSPPGLGMDLEYERYPTDRKVGPKGVPVGGTQGGPVPGFAANPDRQAVLRNQAPPWGIRGNPGMTVPYPGR
jgi:hypothetical protein